MRNRKSRFRALKLVGLTVVFVAVLATMLGGFSPSKDYDRAAQAGVDPEGFIDISSILDISSLFDISTIITLDSHTLSIGFAGTGTGTVTTSLNGDDGDIINCPGDCSDTYSFIAGSPPSVNIFYAAAPGSVFAGSSCGGSVSMSADRSCTATFNLAAGNFPVNVTTAGLGDGSISGPGINCVRTAGVQSGDCSESYLSGTAVTLNATPAGSSSFGGFSSDCTGAVCNLIVNAAKAVTGTFNSTTFPLTVDIQGTGNGVVTSTSGPGIACVGTAGADTGDCSENYAAGTNVTLQATPAGGSTFSGSWGGACAAFGTNPTCTVAMSSAQAVTASFTLSGGGGGGGGTGACTINGTNGPNVLNGTSGNDVICAKGGNDVIDAKGGNDVVRAGKGADVAKGGKGNDTLFGEKGADVLTGGKGTDTASGGPGIDVCTAEVQISCP